MRPPGVSFKGQTPPSDVSDAPSASDAEQSAAAHMELKRAAIIRGLDYLQRAAEAMFRNEQLASRHGADLLLPFYVPPPTASHTPEERHAWKVATRLASEWRTRTVKAASSLPPTSLSPPSPA